MDEENGRRMKSSLPIFLLPIILLASGCVTEPVYSNLQTHIGENISPVTNAQETPTQQRDTTTTTINMPIQPFPGQKSGDKSLYPSPKLTLGAVMTSDKSVVCVKGYTATVRDVSESTHKKVFEEYNISYPQPSGSYEVDHFIPLELGGSNDISNLWPEPARPKPGFHEKDKVENYLHEQVCNYDMSLEEAQKQIATDWYAVYLQINK
jgi:hypothetical protein